MRSSPSYTALFREQIPAVGHRNQHRLRRLSVAVVGVGGVGSVVAQFLALSGVGKLVLIDPQAVEAGNFNRSAVMTTADIGKPKAALLADFLGRRAHVRVRSIVARIESAEAEIALDDVDVVCCCSNTVSSRLAAARGAMARGLTYVSAGVRDAATDLTGRVLVGNALWEGLACEGCFHSGHTGGKRSARGVVLPTVAGVVGALAAHTIISSFLRNSPTGPRRNLYLIDIATFSMESLTVCRRADCTMCKGRPVR